MYDEIEIKERVDRLEVLLNQFIVQTNVSITHLEGQISELKNQKSKASKEINLKDKSCRERRAMNKQWAELINKMGTLSKDIIAPAVRPVVEKYFNVEVTDFMINRKRKSKSLGLTGEFDVIAVSENHLFLVETKSTPRKQYLDEFKENIEKFQKLFPEYINKKLIPIFASLRFEDDIIQLANARRLFLLAYREWDYMDFINFKTVTGNREMKIQQKSV